jgi:ribosomal protein S18 acetylase RimI-like enzyme
MSGLSIARAGAADAARIAAIHVAAWRETYADMMPAATLAGLDVAEWAERWAAKLADPDPASATFLALDTAGTAAGFGHCRRQSSEKLGAFSGEIASIYLLGRIQRRGAGRRLLREMAAHLTSHGCDSASVWVFREAAHARHFYEAHGAAPTGVEGVWEIYGMVLPDMAYGWRDLGGLLSATPGAEGRDS